MEFARKIDQGKNTICCQTMTDDILNAPNELKRLNDYWLFKLFDLEKQGIHCQVIVDVKVQGYMSFQHRIR